MGWMSGLLCVILAWWVMPLSIATAQATTLGPFRPSPALGLYLIKTEPGPITLRVGLHRGPNRNLGDHVSVRIYNPREELVFRRHFNLAEPKEEFILGSMEIEGLDHDMAYGQAPKDKRPWQQMRVNLDEAGIYQVRVTAGSHNTYVTLESLQPMDYGVSFQNGTFSAWEGMPATTWAYVPPRASVLNVSGRGVRVADEGGAALLDHPQDKAGPTKALPVTDTRTLWQWTIDPKASFRAWGFPLILCNTSDAAKAIRASIIELDDGTVVAHQFQKEIYERLRGDLLSPARIGELDKVLPTFTDAHRKAMEQDAIAVSQLVNSRHNFFNYVRELLKRQNTDRASHFAGSLSGWQEVAARPAPDNRWDTYGVVRPLNHGISDGDARWATYVAWLCAELDRPWNPYYGNKQVLNRLAAGAMADLLRLGEDERFPTTQSNDYPGGTAAFYMLWKPASAYGMIAPHMDEDVHALWTRGMERYIGRSYPDTIVSTRNQSAHYLISFLDYAKASRDPAYADLGKAYARRFIDSQADAGYMPEAIGPDGTYNGITHWYMGQYAVEAGNDPAMLESLARSYRFYNHTVGPEPDGRVFGGFNYSHRTASGAYSEQYSGARSLVAHLLPEVAVWRSPLEDRATRQRTAIEEVRKGLAKPQDELARVIYMEFMKGRFKHAYDEPVRATWPALEDKPFIRQFGDELIAVRRPAYFASIYVGKPAAAWYIRAKEDLRKPYANDTESTGGMTGWLNHKPMTPLVGGGLTLMHSPDYGNSVLAAPWSPLTYHGPVLVKDDTTRWWAEYHATAFKLDEQAGLLTVQGRIEKTPVTYVRQYTFADDALHVALTLKAEGDAVSAAELFENIPLAMGKAKARGVRVLLGNGQPAPVAQVVQMSTLQLRDEKGNGLDIVFDQPQEVYVQPNGMQERTGLQVGRVQVMLPASLPAGQSITLKYTLRPVNNGA